MREHLIAGSWEKSSASEPVIAPYSGEVLEEMSIADAHQIERAMAQAAHAEKSLASLPTHRRVEILRSVAKGLGVRREAVATTLSQEAAKPIDFARGEVERAIQTFHFAADELVAERGEVIPMDAAPKGEGLWGLTKRFPIGPVLAITPFNFPLNLVAHKLAPAIAASCPILIKPANKTPLSALLLAEVVLEAGWPPQALSVLNVALEDAPKLVCDERFKLLSFTGSEGVGWQLKAQAGRKKCLLELGGDAALIVAEDASNMEAIAERVAFGAFAYAGQVCISVQRALVHERHHEAFLHALIEAIERGVRSGPPEREGVMMSGLIDDAARQKVNRVLAESIAAGATCHLGGHADTPSVLSDVPEGAPLDHEEIFGPALHIKRFCDLEDAIHEVNRSRFGLHAGLFSDRIDTITACFDGLKVGGLMVNNVPTFRVDHMPYGGIKDSGLGREGLRYAHREYTEPRLLVWPYTSSTP